MSILCQKCVSLLVPLTICQSNAMGCFVTVAHIDSHGDDRAHFKKAPYIVEMPWTYHQNLWTYHGISWNLEYMMEI